MTFTKIISVVLLLVDSYLGSRFLLNVLGVLHTSKYSSKATALYAVFFLALSISGFYLLIMHRNPKIVLWLSVGPWILILTVVLWNMIFGDYH